MQRLEVSGAVRPIYGSLGVKRLTTNNKAHRWPRIRTPPTILYLNAADPLPNPKRCWLVCVRALTHLPDVRTCLRHWPHAYKTGYKNAKVLCCVLCFYKRVSRFGWSRSKDTEVQRQPPPPHTHIQLMSACSWRHSTATLRVPGQHYMSVKHNTCTLTLILLTWRIGWAHNNARK